MAEDTPRGTATPFLTPAPSMAPGTTHAGFVVESADPLPEIDGSAYVLRHVATGARALWLACADTNKAFSIAFKTPPTDDTGVFHILEHSVLCGSDRYPVKEPFVNLLKTSMQTFLNALTFPDKTMYPVASTNAQDLENLMEVYLDAVFHPAITHRPRIFEQEGWHYELAEKDDDLSLNGVVLNEMKGALSDPDDVMYLEMSRALFPDTCYACESGGHPDTIPDLTYETFLDTHARHYQPSNSYVTLYGDLDVDHFLGLVDDALLGAVRTDVGVPNPLRLQAPVTPPTRHVEMATSPDNAAVGLAYVIGTSHDPERVLATDVLLDALLGSNEAPLKRAVLDAHLGDDVVGMLSDGCLQPFVFIELKGAHEGVADEFRTLVESTCARLSKEGLGHDNLAASLAQAEFNLREGDYGYPDGVALAMNALSGWLYDDGASCDYLRYEDTLTRLREGLDEGLFEHLLAELVCQSDHHAQVELDPVAKERDNPEATRLASARAAMDDADVEACVAETAALHAEQSAPDSPEALATLPRLTVADIGDAAPEPVCTPEQGTPVPSHAHDIPTHHIDYAYLYFDLSCLHWAELPYASVLTSLLGQLDTKLHTAEQLDTLVETDLGNLDFFCETYGDAADPMVARPRLVVSASALSENVEALATIPAEVWGKTLFADKERIRAILTQRRISLEQGFVSAGHTAALSRVASYTSAPARVAQQMGGVDYYRFLKRLLANFDDRFQGLTEICYNICGRIFCADGAEASLTGTPEDRARYWEAAGDLGLDDEHHPFGVLEVPPATSTSEAFVVPSDVCYVGEGMDASALGETVSGPWLVAGRALSFDYLWNEVRVLGGAYGCGFRCTPLSQLQFYSYRDPAVDPTVARFEGASAWLASWKPTAAELDGYVVSAVAGHDAPVKPRALARRQDSLRLSGRTPQWREQVRQGLLDCTADDVRKLAEPLSQLPEHRGTCVFGGRDVIAASTADLDVQELVDDGRSGSGRQA
jgi:Zn-dependent M16 (insulinase) family peptidase